MSRHIDSSKRMIAIRKCLRQKGSSVHMPGICGMGMAGLAFILKKRGFTVSGCDERPNHLAAWLKKNGIKVFTGHAPAHTTKADWVIRSTAVRADNPEIQAARQKGKPVFLRGAVLATISAATDSICVCGTHGKTTTTAMIAQLLKRTGRKPSFCIGGEVSALGGVAGRGHGKNIVLEADESDGTLALYRPSLLVITNIEFDHAEHFTNLASFRKCFEQAAGRTRQKVIYCFDDPQARKIMRNRPNTWSYGFSAEADLRLTDFRENSKGLSFSLKIKSGPRGRDAAALPSLTLPVPGRHNALNAAAACAVGFELGLPLADIAAALAEFRPVTRRFEKIVESRDLLVISDYAHHPSEIAALIRGAQTLRRKRWLAVFQPHRYTRTKALGKLFPPAFRGIAELVLCPVYEASEPKIPGGTSWDLYRHFRRHGQTRTVCARNLSQAWDYLKTILEPGDGLLIVGAGDIYKIGEWAGKEKLNFASWKLRASKLPDRGLKSSPLKINEPLAGKTSLRVGGSADIYIEAGHVRELARILKWSRRKNIPVRILGAGSNLLVSDLGVRGIVLRLKGPGWGGITRLHGAEIAAGAGTGLQKLAAWAAKHGLTGAEFLTGIPGTLGGALRMNAGAGGREIKDIAARVKIMDETGNIKIRTAKQLGFGYRSCTGLENKIVLEAALRLQKGNARAIHKRMRLIRERRKWMQGLRSAGSVFKNPPGTAAGRLIDRLALKGSAVGGAKISEQHANVIVTGKNANASDVMALIEITRDLVRAKSGVALENEIEYFE